MEGRDFSSSPPARRPAADTSQNQLPTQRKKKNKNARRFNDDQVKSLESIFKLETKLEPRKKLQLARELELQPRQVAIWFQNRRARWKSKQLEQEYRVLKDSYDNLNLQFKSLEEEKQSLVTQLQKLNDMLKETHDSGSEDKASEGRNTNRDLENENTSDERKAASSSLTDRLDKGSNMHSDNDERGNEGYLAQYEEPELMSLCEQLDSSLATTGKWCDFDSSSISDQTCGTSNWWDYWP